MNKLRTTCRNVHRNIFCSIHITGFTIFTHKQFAAGLGQFEVGESVDSGEVTLF